MNDVKKYSLIFLFLCTVAIVYLAVSHEAALPHSPDEKFVSLNGRQFMVNSKPFYPIALNYIATLETDGRTLWPAISTDYTLDRTNEKIREDSSLIRLKADILLVKKMGFNTIRIVGIGEEMVDDKKRNGDISVRAYYGNDKFTSITIASKESYEKYFIALEKLFKIIADADLKVIFLLRMNVDNHSTQIHLEKMAARFKNNPAILAFDLFNEPLYFDGIERPKLDVYYAVNRWTKAFRTIDSNHLLTIGLEGIREVFEWDPNILNVDFVSFHPYEYEPEQVRNEIRWYGKYIDKPWIIGETAIAADDDSVTYEEQKQFAIKTLKQTYNCGASGYSWWQYKDVAWPEYHASYMGAVNRKGETAVDGMRYKVKGTPKPLSAVFKNVDLASLKDSCYCLSNYYNYTANNKFRITGKVVDENTDKPIEGAVILAWNQWWSHSYHTITKADGSFELYSNYPFYHWMASATYYSMVRGDILPDTARTKADNIPTINIGELSINKIKFR